jgi:hypothetical protein
MDDVLEDHGVKATSLIKVRRLTVREQMQAERFAKQAAPTQPAYIGDERNARMAEIMYRCRAAEMRKIQYEHDVLHRIDALDHRYLALVAACEAEGTTWREVARYPGKGARRAVGVSAKRLAVIRRLRADGLSWPEIGMVLNTNHTSAFCAFQRAGGAA